MDHPIASLVNGAFKVSFNRIKDLATRFCVLIRKFSFNQIACESNRKIFCCPRPYTRRHE